MTGADTADERLEEQVPIISYESEMHILQNDIQVKDDGVEKKEVD